MKRVVLSLLLIGMLAILIGCTEPEGKCTPENRVACDRACTTNSDCSSHCACGCISSTETCDTDVLPPPCLLKCECVEGICREVEIEPTNLTECETVKDCEGQPTAHQCVGEWACINGNCEWWCQVECSTDEECEVMEYGCEMDCDTGLPVKKCVKGACICQCPPTESALNEFHEWGVIVGCTSSDEAFVTSRPKQLMLVKQPVIYLHGDDGTSVDVQVEFTQGNITDTYPQAEITGNMLTWDDVLIQGECKEKTKGVGISMGYVPLEDIIDDLNDVDADCLYKGMETHFLFYEGEMEFESNVEVSLDGDSLTIRNNRKKPIHNVMYVQGEATEGMFQIDTKIIGWEKIEAGQGTAFNVTKEPALMLSPKKSLEKMGFTEKEAMAFENIWNSSFFAPGNTPFKQLIFRLDQEEYDEMFPLTVEPTPEKTVRAMYVLLEID